MEEHVPESTEKTHSSSSKARSVVLMTLLSTPVALVLVAVMLIVAKRRRQRQAAFSTLMDEYDRIESMRNFNPIELWNEPELQQWRLDVIDLDLIAEIGKGSHCVVWLARYMTETVTVKRFVAPQPRSLSAYECFHQEIKAHARWEHDKIVQFLGISWTTDRNFQMILEFMSNGPLLKTTKSDPNLNLRHC